MFKKHALTAAALLAVSASSFAADPEVNFNVKATITGDDFYVYPVNDWHKDPIELTWDGSKLLPRDGMQIRMKNTTGKIQAKLAEQPMLIAETDNSKTIPLTIKVGSTTLSTTAQDLTSAVSTAEERQLVTVSPGAGASYAFLDAYNGDVSMIFEPATVGGGGGF